MQIDDYVFYAETFHKIKTKVDGITPFLLRKYQRRFIDFTRSIEGPKRIIAVKPRQCGFTTQTSSIFSHLMVTQHGFTGMCIADEYKRTLEASLMYHTFLDQLHPRMIPMIKTRNTEEIHFENPNEKLRAAVPGLGSGIKFTTANDENAGKSAPRMFGHLTEAAFYRYALEIDTSLQNSIPLHPRSWIIKESTANGRSGIGAPFYLLYEAAVRGDSIYKPFFISWWEVDDYSIEPPRGMVLDKIEKEMLKEFPEITKANLAWRRLKMSEYLNDENGELSVLPPVERFQQDFPNTWRTAFLSSGSPVFPVDLIDKASNILKDNFIPNIKDRLKIDCYIVRQFWEGLVILTPPRGGKRYYVGADVAEGLAEGDSSSICIIDEDMNDVAYWHGKIDADIFGHLLISLGMIYNEALLAIEKNNMGHTTVTTVRNEGYRKIYKVKEEDMITKKTKVRYGWVTTSKSKMEMLNELLKHFRQEEFKPRNIKLIQEMGMLSREPNGDVSLNGRDRTVAACIALMARRHNLLPGKISVANKSSELYDTSTSKKKNADIFG